MHPQPGPSGNAEHGCLSPMIARGLGTHVIGYFKEPVFEMLRIEPRASHMLANISEPNPQAQKSPLSRRWGPVGEVHGGSIRSSPSSITELIPCHTSLSNAWDRCGVVLWCSLEPWSYLGTSDITRKLAGSPSPQPAALTPLLGR